MANDQLIRFYTGTGTDDRGRTIADVWRFSTDELEDVHDYIQWLFPLAERSAFNPAAPLVDAETARRFQSDAVLRKNLERSLELMLEFYDLAEPSDRLERRRPWLTPHNHNFLRLTRMLKSLSCSARAIAPPNCSRASRRPIASTRTSSARRRFSIGERPSYPEEGYSHPHPAPRTPHLAPHSYRSASTGSTRAARRAGM